MSSAGFAEVVPEPTPSEPINYINPNIPKVPEPEYKGRRYEALVPATFDLAERSALTINALTEMLNPNSDLEAYWTTDLLSDPPRMDLQYGAMIRFLYFQEIPLVRTVCGSDQNLDREHKIMEMQLKMQGPDGLIYSPLKGRPWAQPPAGWGDDETEHLGMLTWDNGRSLGAFAIYALKDPDGPWREAARRCAEGLKKTIIVEDDIAYLFQQWMEPGYPITKPEKKPTRNAAAKACMTAHGLAQYHRLLKTDPEALEIAHKMMRYIMRDSNYFGPEGEFLRDHEIPEGESDEGSEYIWWEHISPSIHFHEHGMPMTVSLEIVEMTGDEYLLKRAIQAYNWAKSPACKGDPIVGFFPEFLHDEPHEYFTRVYGGTKFQSESCNVSDMIIAGMMLARLGVKNAGGTDPWDDADRWTRNQLAENQLTSLNWLYDGHFELPDREGKRLQSDSFTTVRVAERSLGSFSGWSLPNDWLGPVALSVMNCCTVNGAKSLYYIWRYMLSHDEGTLRVHLLFNRASKWADIDSHIPYKGQVDVHVKKNLDLEVRIPEWVKPEEARCTVDGKTRDLSFSGRYAKIGKVKRSQTATLTFPIIERTDKISIQGDDFTIVRRGNTVVSIDPPGKIRPFYKRGHYRNGQTLWKKTTHFVPDDDLFW